MSQSLLYPAEPEVFERILSILGQPRNVELIYTFKGDKYLEFLQPEKADWFSIKLNCELTVERVLQLYKEYVEGYVMDVKEATESEKRLSSFKAHWYVGSSLVDFDSFQLKIDAKENLENAFEQNLLPHNVL